MSGSARSRVPGSSLSLVSLGILTGLTALTSFGQVSAVRSGSFEVGPFVGGSFVLGGAQAMIGGNVTYALKNKYVLPYFEYTHFLLPAVGALRGTISGGGGTYFLPVQRS